MYLCCFLVIYNCGLHFSSLVVVPVTNGREGGRAQTVHGKILCPVCLSRVVHCANKYKFFFAILLNELPVVVILQSHFPAFFACPALSYLLCSHLLCSHSHIHTSASLAMSMRKQCKGFGTTVICMCKWVCVYMYSAQKLLTHIQVHTRRRTYNVTVFFVFVLLGKRHEQHKLNYIAEWRVKGGDW